MSCGFTGPPDSAFEWLKALKGDLKAQHSIRINMQWRVCFKWRDEEAFEVEIVVVTESRDFVRART